MGDSKKHKIKCFLDSWTAALVSKAPAFAKCSKSLACNPNERWKYSWNQLKQLCVTALRLENARQPKLTVWPRLSRFVHSSAWSRFVHSSWTGCQFRSVVIRSPVNHGAFTSWTGQQFRTFAKRKKKCSHMLAAWSPFHRRLAGQAQTESRRSSTHDLYARCG